MEVFNRERQLWFASRKWGMFCHFFGFSNNNWRTGFKTYKDYNDRVNNFNVENFAKTAHEVNAGYVVFTMMQQEKYICAPNETFNKITGYKTGEACSERDLVADLIKALDKYDIPLFLYFTGDGPFKDEIAGKAFNYHDRENESVNPEFIEKWTSVLREYAIRYGDKVHGWWIDGIFDYFGYLDHDDDYIKPYRDAIMAGNPNALVCYNNGVLQIDLKDPAYKKYHEGTTNYLQVLRNLEAAAEKGDKLALKAFERIPGNSYRYSKYEDYTAGEANEFSELPTSQFVDGSLWHISSFLGQCIRQPNLWGKTAWNQHGSKYSTEYMMDYIKKVNEKGGVVSIDTCLYDDGHIDWGQYEILKKLGELRK